jgi:hypothetical protein
MMFLIIIIKKKKTLGSFVAGQFFQRFVNYLMYRSGLLVDCALMNYSYMWLRT